MTGSNPSCPHCGEPVSNGVQGIVGIAYPGGVYHHRLKGPWHLGCIEAVVQDVIDRAIAVGGSS